MAQRIYFGKMKLIRRVDTRLPDPEYQDFLKNRGSRKTGQYLRELIIAHNEQIRSIRENFSSSADANPHHPEMKGYRTISIVQTNDHNNEQSKKQ